MQLKSLVNGEKFRFNFSNEIFILQKYLVNGMVLVKNGRNELQLRNGNLFVHKILK